MFILFNLLLNKTYHNGPKKTTQKQNIAFTPILNTSDFYRGAIS